MTYNGTELDRDIKHYENIDTRTELCGRDNTSCAAASFGSSTFSGFLIDNGAEEEEA